VFAILASEHVRAAGGVVLRGGKVCIIHRPDYEDWSLPKGKLDGRESHEQAALREVHEETGLRAEALHKLPSSRYVYRRGPERIFKLVEWWLMRPLEGEIGAIEEAMRVEVADARWLPLDEADALLAYPGERSLLEPARAMIDADQSQVPEAG
jgi:8-oxo-dGTP diphosphatase